MTPDTKNSRRTVLICLLLAAITLGVYWPVVRFQFINLDDGAYVTENPYVRGGLSLQGLVWAFKVGYGGNWDPLTWISHMLDCELYGLRAGGHHFTSLLFHTANAVLLFLVLQRLTGATWRSGFVAALFAWHPLHVESAAWVAERKDVLSTFFGLLAIGAYAAYVKKSQVSSLKSPDSLQSQVSSLKSPDSLQSSVSSLQSATSVGGIPDKSGPRELERLETRDRRLETGDSIQNHAPRSTLHAPRRPASSILHPPSARFWYAVALACFALGLMSKPMLVTLPFVLLLLDYWPLQRSAEWGMPSAECGQAGAPAHHSKLKIKNLKFKIPLPFLREKLPFFALAALCCFLTVKAQAGSYAVIGLETLPLSARVANALVSYVLYLWKMIWPRDLAVLYPYSHAWGLLATAGAGVLLLLISAGVIWQGRRRPYLAVGWFWFLGTLVPVIGLVQVGLQRMGDRYTYIPLSGVFVAVVWGVADFWANWERRRPRRRVDGGDTASAGTLEEATPARTPALPVAVAVLVLIALIVCTRAQLAYWQNSVALFSHATKVAPNSLLTEYSLARALGDQGNQEQAIIHYLKVLQIRPNRIEASRNWQLYARLNLGGIYVNQGRWRQAEAQYRALLGQELGLRQAKSAPVSQSLGAASRVEAWRWFGLALNKQGKSAEALGAYREAVRLNPNGPVELNDLAWFLATDPHAELRDGNEAVRLAQRACELTGGREPRCLGTLDAAYAEVGRFADAIATAQTAQAVALAQRRNDVVAAAAERLEAYRAGRPYRQAVSQ